MNRKTLTLCLSTALYASLAGCATSDWNSGGTGNTNTGAEQQTIAEQQSRIDSLEAELQAKDSKLRQQESALASGSANNQSSGMSDLFPPDSKPGHCYARVLIPATWAQTTETVVVREASERVEIIPAQYETVQERVMVREASTRLEMVPARYETVEERIMVRPESKRIEEVPATYKTVSEQVMISPARTEWKRGAASTFGDTVVQSRTTDTGEVMCLVEIPAQYETVTRKVVDQPAGTREIVIPAEYKTVKKTVLAAAATTREVAIPAEYSTVEVQKIVTPASERRIAIPAQYDEVTKRTVQGQDRMEWREVLCQVNMTDENIRTLQIALRNKGYDVGPIDGVLGHQTLVSANKYAQSNGLPYGSNYIAIETAGNLGLKL